MCSVCTNCVRDALKTHLVQTIVRSVQKGQLAPQQHTVASDAKVHENIVLVKTRVKPVIAAALTHYGI